jgi:hypothetical protein
MNYAGHCRATPVAPRAQALAIDCRGAGGRRVTIHA